MVYEAGLPLNTPLDRGQSRPCVLAGACWLPVAWLADPDAQAGGCGGSTGAGSAGRLLAPGAVVVLARRAGVHAMVLVVALDGMSSMCRSVVMEEPDATGLGRSVDQLPHSLQAHYLPGTTLDIGHLDVEYPAFMQPVLVRPFPTWAHWFVVVQGRCRRASEKSMVASGALAPHAALPRRPGAALRQRVESGPAGHVVEFVNPWLGLQMQPFVVGQQLHYRGVASSPEWALDIATSPSGWRSDTPRSWSAQSTNTTSRWTSGWSIRCSGRCSAIQGRSGQMQARTPASQRLDFDLGVAAPSAKGYATSSMRPQ